MNIADKDFTLQINTDYTNDIYLSCSWRPGAGQDATWLILNELDQMKIRALGDVRDLREQDDKRIIRIMSRCNGFVVILPFREEEPTKTSRFIFEEIRYAASQGIPIALFYERRIPLDLTSEGSNTHVSFINNPIQKGISIENKNLFGPFKFDEGSSKLSHQITGKLDQFIESAKRTRFNSRPYAFLITRVKADFSLARSAITTAVSEEAGIPCLWSGDNIHTTNIESIRESTRLLIKNAEFIVADFTLGSESPEVYNPSRALELGIAMAYRRPVLMFAQGPRKDPFFAAGDLQVFFWENEEQLYNIVKGTIYSKRADLGRWVWNYELKKRDADYPLKISIPKFHMDSSYRYIAPNHYPLSTLESWLVAIGFAVTAWSLASIVENSFGFSGTFDFTSLLAGIFTLVFASDINKQIRQALGRYATLRWLIPIAGLISLLISVFLTNR
jgi:hypothetical protein